ncbi:MAG: hypothetical protein EON54_05570 [Alcaligenaceae bacterium]|nr:MAG: hypothetical protein EON54_05570 [Alcaligenaceae bacterium]
MKTRLAAAVRPALLSLAVSLLVLAILGLLVFYVWFPYPYDDLSNGKTLFVILCVVTVTCGPLLTFLLFDPAKNKWKWYIDVALILSLQLGAIVYGVHALALSRPIFLAYEGDRFRVVRAADIVEDELSQALPEFRMIQWSGPKLIGVKLLKSTDPNYLNSLTRAVQGEHPAYRPARWVAYSTQRAELVGALKPISGLPRSQVSFGKISDLESYTKLSDSQLGYLPLVQHLITDWVVIVSREDGLPKAFLNIDGWN